MSLSNLAPRQARADRIAKARMAEQIDHAKVARSIPVTPVPAPPATEPLAVERRRLTLDEARALSVDSINLLIPKDPAFVAKLIIAAGQRRRAELPLTPTELKPAARCILLAGEKRRGRELNEEENAFMADFLGEVGA